MSESFKPELLSLILLKSFWKANKHLVLKSMFAPPMDKLFLAIESFHDQYTEDLDKFKLWEIVKIDNPTMTTSQKAELWAVVDKVGNYNNWTPEFANKVLTAAWKEEVFTQVAKYGIDGAQGRVKDLEGLKEIVDKHGAHFIPKNTFVECVDDIDDLLLSDTHLKKWKFNLEPLAEKVGDLNPGHFFQFMGRPDAGKTAFIISSVAGPGGWAEQGAVVDWYVNEEPVKRTRWRCMSAYSGLTKEQLTKDVDNAKKVWNKVKENIRTIDIPFGTPVEQIAFRTRDRKPDIVIVDQIDKLGVRPLAGQFSAETERIRLLYIKFREIAKQHDCMVVGVCQASADAEGKRVVTYDMAENSKTGKAAECDLFAAVGRNPLSDITREEDYTRWITVSKSKLDGGWKGSVTCRLEPQISRYVK